MLAWTYKSIGKANYHSIDVPFLIYLYVGGLPLVCENTHNPFNLRSILKLMDELTISYQSNGGLLPAPIHWSLMTSCEHWLGVTPSLAGCLPGRLVGSSRRETTLKISLLHKSFRLGYLIVNHLGLPLCMVICEFRVDHDCFPLVPFAYLHILRNLWQRSIPGT